MFLKSLELRNFRCFSEMKVEFYNRLTVVVGNNGAGKSTVLEAATIAAGTLTSAMDGLTNYGIRKSDAHYKCYQLGSNIDVQPQFPVEIIASGMIGGENCFVDKRLVFCQRKIGAGSSKRTDDDCAELSGKNEKWRPRIKAADYFLLWNRSALGAAS